MARIVRLSGGGGSPLRWEEVAILEPGEAVTQHDEEEAEDAEDARTRRRGCHGLRPVEEAEPGGQRGRGRRVRDTQRVAPLARQAVAKDPV